MGATYTRQSSSAIVDGGVIEASDLNAEFNQILAAFAVTSGHTHDGTAAEGGPITKLLGTAITIGDATSGTDIAVTFDGESADGVLTWMEDEDYFQFSDDLLLTTTEKLQFRDTAIYINSSADGQLDLVADTEIQIAATTIDINGAVDISGALTLAGTTLAETISDTVGAMVSSNTETGITVSYEDGDNTLDFALGAAQTTITSLLATDIKIGEDDQTKIDFETADEIHFYAANVEQVYLGDNIFGPQSDSDVDLGSTGVRWKDAFIDTITTTGNVTVGGDLTVTGDDITMGTNTAGNLLVADGTNFNSIAATSLTEISTVANDDVFIAVDTSGGGLKKIARSAIVAGLATSSAISNVADDSTPQLGGNLDMNGSDIVTTSNATIDLAPNGTGTVVVRGNTNSGRIVYNCESNSHGQTLASQPHSAAVTNTMLLPAGANSTLVSLVSTDTLTNKTLTSPVINTGTFGTSILPTSADGTTLGSASKEFSDLFLADGAVVNFGNDQDVSLTHVADTGLLLSSGDQLQFGNAGENISGDGTDLTIAGNNINLTATADVVIPANVGITFGTGEKIEGDSTDLTITSGADINLTATADINVPSGVGMTFGDDGEKIEGDGTDLTIASSNDLHLTATTDINIPANVGLTFGDDGEKIEGDGTNLTLSSSNSFTVDANGGIYLDSNTGLFEFRDDGTQIGRIQNVSSDFVIHTKVQDKDFIIKGDDGGSDITALTLDMSAAGAATFNDKVIAEGGQLTTTGKSLVFGF